MRTLSRRDEPGGQRPDFAQEGESSRSCCLCINIVHKPEAKRASHVESKKKIDIDIQENPWGGERRRRYQRRRSERVFLNITFLARGFAREIGKGINTESLFDCSSWANTLYSGASLVVLCVYA